MAIRNVVFDMGNVLLNWDAYQPCMRYAQDPALAKKLFEAIFADPDWCRLTDSGIMTDKAYFEQVKQKFDDPAERALIDLLYRDYDVDALSPVKKSEKLVEELLDKGYHLFLLSNAGFRFREYLYKIRNIERFDGVVISAEVDMLKPDVKIYNYLCDTYGIKPEETLFVDDLPENIQGAKNAGWQGFLYDTQDADGVRAYLGLC